MGLYSTTTKSATNFYNVGYMTNDGNVIKVGLWPSKKIALFASLRAL